MRYLLFKTAIPLSPNHGNNACTNTRRALYKIMDINFLPSTAYPTIYTSSSGCTPHNPCLISCAISKAIHQIGLTTTILLPARFRGKKVMVPFHIQNLRSRLWAPISKISNRTIIKRALLKNMSRSYSILISILMRNISSSRSPIKSLW